MPRPLQVFLCHASQDKPEVWKLHRYLKSRGVKPWLDQADLLPGEHWETEIPKALFASDVILVCISKNSINKAGYVQKEIAFALDKALEKPEGTIFIIPVRLEDCELPKRLSSYQAVELFQEGGGKKLLLGLNKRSTELGKEILPVDINEAQDNDLKLKPNRNKMNPVVFSWLAIFILLLIWSGQNLFAKKLPSHPTLTFQSPIISPTPTYVPFTQTPTQTPGIGSTMIGMDGMVLLFVPAGNFVMGSDTSDQSDERPAHLVYLDSFWIDKTEVTNAMYEKCVENGSCEPPLKLSSKKNEIYYSNSEFDNYPVNYISWSMAKNYCIWVDRDLPTEAQWEKAARGTDGREYPWGNMSLSPIFLNYQGSNIGDTTEVGKYPNGASIYGVLDMAGNVYEWVNDWYSDSYYSISPLSNPLGPDAGREKIVKGGAWGFSSVYARSAYRNFFKPEDVNNYGFRCVMTALP